MEATAACSRKVARDNKSISCKFKWVKLCSNLIKAYIRPKSRMLRVHRKVLRKFALKIVLSRVYFRFQTLPSSVGKIILLLFQFFYAARCQRVPELGQSFSQVAWYLLSSES